MLHPDLRDQEREGFHVAMYFLVKAGSEIYLYAAGCQV
ncbi:hypothetical protein X766_33465 [Mesorhizobium sp. LSJC255A00]|nr:hypothetical protein X766_33465 [Mesorhizobium sp. LSJC255A00]